MERSYSFIVPVFNRPEEIEELLTSIEKLDTVLDFEIVIVEDGSTVSSRDVCKNFSKLNISYYTKENSGPGDSRNYGMKLAKGNYFIILDSDVMLPAHYLTNVDAELEKEFTDFYGGPDTAHPSFTSLQKAINFSMTSFLTTGGIRGQKKGVQKFEPRSFNLGLSKRAFEASEGFGNIHPGEDPDLVIRLWKKGFKSRFLEDAFVYHKRRISWRKFFTQVSKFGAVRPILNVWHPERRSPSFWLPTIFVFGLMLSILFFFIFHSFIFLSIYIVYSIVLFLNASYSNRSLRIGLLAVFATFLQFIGYGYSFLKSSIVLFFTKKEIEDTFPHLFFK